MEGPMIGTSIKNLQDMSQTQYNAGQNMHYEQGHNAAHHTFQAQHTPYFNSNNNAGYPQFNQQQTGQQYPGYLTPNQKKEIIDIEELAKDINDNLPEDTFTSVSDIEEENTKTSGIISHIPPMVREPLLILGIFILLSLPVVKENLGKYIKQINPDVDGTVGFSGIIIYGILLAALYAIAKKVIIG